jgi:GNAT superfamily N-acetyltransferase
MLHANANTLQVRPSEVVPFMAFTADLHRVCELRQENTAEVLGFLNIRPVHTVVMTSFIKDNGIESELNRGKFYGYRNTEGQLEGVALIGHSTLVESHSDAALRALALTARRSETPIHLIMSSGDAARTFWNYLSDGLTQPRLTCVERLFEAAFPFMVQVADTGLRLAEASELIAVAEAQAEVAFIESGVDPMLKDREGFLKRVARRIEQGRIFVVFDGDKLVFKADIIAETDDVAYLEGVFVGHEYRGKGFGPKCLSALTVELLSRVSNVCLLSNVDFTAAHRSFEKAGFRNTDECTTLFV